MYDALGTLYQSMNISSEIFPRNKITTTFMCMTDTVASYVMKLATRDQLGAVGDNQRG